MLYAWPPVESRMGKEFSFYSFHLIICPSCVWGFIGHKLCLLISQAHEQEALASLESFLAKCFLGKSTTVFKCSEKSKEAVN